MQVPPMKPQSNDENGFLQNSFNQLNSSVQKPVLWLVLSIFILMTGAGYWIGTTMVINPTAPETYVDNSYVGSIKNTYLLLEADDLSLDEPELLSVWFIHINSSGKPKLGFTPVVSKDMVDSEDYYILQNFSLTAEKQPGRNFLSLVAKRGFSTQNYIIIDQNSMAAFINWFAGKELSSPLALDQHSMAQYGPILRGFCSSLSSANEKGLVDFPWSKIAQGHFYTSLSFNNVIKNLAFLTSPKAPQCEMVPMP